MSVAIALPLRPLPPPREGAFVAAHHDPRPCVTYPVGWWDTGDRNNARAIKLCDTVCPLRAECAPKGKEKPQGVIRAGVVYDDHGDVQRLCRNCQRPLNRATQNATHTCEMCRRGRLAAHHGRIAELVEAGSSWAVIGRAIDYHPDTVRKYWLRQQAVAA
ncbi:hypothetical protein AB0J14_38575 [Micromonospora arborensis]|uniref:hypothetical protein n=1 Tax=Micromonospora arborensis TaxID=2116518 RepID=UPI0034119898